MNKEQQQICDEAYKNYVKSFFKGELKENYEGSGYDFDDYYYSIIDVQNLLGWPQNGPISQKEFINECKTNTEFYEKWGLKIEERELSLEERLPKKIKLTGHGDVMEFSLTDKRELNYYGRTKESNESKWRTEKLKDNEVFYETEFGWGVFLNTDTFETVTYDGTEWGSHKLNIPTKLITVTRELSMDERVTIFNEKKEKGEIVVPEIKSVGDMNAWTNKLLDNNIPTNKTIESYE